MAHNEDFLTTEQTDFVRRVVQSGSTAFTLQYTTGGSGIRLGQEYLPAGCYPELRPLVDCGALKQKNDPLGVGAVHIHYELTELGIAAAQPGP